MPKKSGNASKDLEHLSQIKQGKAKRTEQFEEEMQFDEEDDTGEDIDELRKKLRKCIAKHMACERPQPTLYTLTFVLKLFIVEP